MLTVYRSNTYIPPLVKLSKALANKYDFNHSCSDETGRLLSVLSGQVRQGKILEIGTGLGVGSSWILSNISSSVKFISIDNAQQKVVLTRETIVHEQAEFVYGDWKEIINQGPFQLIFADAAVVKTVEGENLDEGGTLLMDDFTPEWIGKPDKVRKFWLNHDGLIATEIYLTPRSSAIIATKLRASN